MKYGNINICNKLATQLTAVFVILLILLSSGCNRISPKLQDEYIREGLNQNMRNVFDKYRKSIIDIMDESKIPGLSYVLVDRDGILWAAGFGYTDYDRKRPVTTDTRFLICSMSKTITAAAVMVAVQDGLVELDVPIIKYFPQFKVNSRFEESPEKKITLRHLLSHTSGLAHEAPVGNAMEPSYGSLEEHVMSISDTWLRHKIGARHSYSGLGYDLVAYIIQIKSGQPFAKYVDDKIFAPLNMSKCSADPDVIRNDPNRAIGHMPFFKQVPLAMDVPWVASGGIYANAKGMARFVQFFLNDGKVDGRTIIDESLIKSMLTPPTQTRNYGLGVDISHINGILALGHGGGGVGFLSDMRWLPEYGIGCVYLANSLNVNQSLNNLVTDLIDEKLVQKNDSFEIPSSKYQTYQPLDPNTFTPFKPEWKKYIGTYRRLSSGYKAGILVRTILRLGLTTNYTHVKVFEKDGYLYVKNPDPQGDDGGRLDEYLPGLFFTPTGKCLDLRGPAFTIQNYRIVKVDNDADMKFDLNL